jgi:SAM-dependent methyltransferase
LNTDWHQTFFHDLAVEFWLTAAPSAHNDLALLTEVFGAPEGKHLLDLACGAGRHSIPLARRGYEVTGVDASDEFLQHAKRASDGLDVHYRLGDMRDLPWRAHFDGALCMGNSFGYLDRKEMRKVVAALAGALKPGAALVIESGATAESLLPSIPVRRWIEVAGILLLSEARYDLSDSRLDIDYTFIKGDRRESKTAHTWVYTIGELRDMLSDHGFAIDRLYASPDKEPYRLGSQRLLLVGRH